MKEQPNKNEKPISQEPSLDFRDDTEVRIDMLTKVRAGKIGELDPRELKIYNEQVRDEWEGDQKRWNER